MKRFTAALFIAAFIAGPAALAQDFPEFTDHVVDEAGVVDDSAEERINGALAAYQSESGNQIAVAVLRSIGDENLEDYSNDLFEAWGIGDKEKDNGALLLIAMAERKLRIEVGFGLEGDLTDLESGRIIRDVIAPAMRDGDVGNAVSAGVNAMADAIGGKPLPLPVEQPAEQPDSEPGSGFGSFIWLVPFLIFGPLSALGRRGRFGTRGTVGRRGGRRDDDDGGGWLAPLVVGAVLGDVLGGGRRGGFGGGGFGGGGFGGGGFGGGGGGGSGGGGASGGW